MSLSQLFSVLGARGIVSACIMRKIEETMTPNERACKLWVQAVAFLLLPLPLNSSMEKCATGILYNSLRVFPELSRQDTQENQAKKNHVDSGKSDLAVFCFTFVFTHDGGGFMNSKLRGMRQNSLSKGQCYVASGYPLSSPAMHPHGRPCTVCSGLSTSFVPRCPQEVFSSFCLTTKKPRFPLLHLHPYRQEQSLSSSINLYHY